MRELNISAEDIGLAAEKGNVLRVDTACHLGDFMDLLEQVEQQMQRTINVTFIESEGSGSFNYKIDII